MQKQHLGLVMNIFSALSKKSECEEHLNARHSYAVLWSSVLCERVFCDLNEFAVIMLMKCEKSFMFSLGPLWFREDPSYLRHVLAISLGIVI